jgi:hypothetical protein
MVRTLFSTQIFNVLLHQSGQLRLDGDSVCIFKDIHGGERNWLLQAYAQSMDQWTERIEWLAEELIDSILHSRKFIKGIPPVRLGDGFLPPYEYSNEKFHARMARGHPQGRGS